MPPVWPPQKPKRNFGGTPPPLPVVKSPRKPPSKGTLESKTSEGSEFSVSRRHDEECTIFLRLQDGSHNNVTGVKLKSTFADLKSHVWKRKGFNPSLQNDFVVKMTNSDIYFHDQESISNLVYYTSLFEDELSQRVEARIYPIADLCDAYKLRNKRPLDNVKYERQGMLAVRTWKGWKWKWFALQGHVLFSWDNEEASNNPGVSPGDIHHIRHAHLKRYENDKKKKVKGKQLDHKFQIGLVSQEMPLVLAAETEQDYNMWEADFHSLVLNKIKMIVACCAEAISARDAFDTEGLFRVSGSKQMCEMLLQEFGRGNTPSLVGNLDIHAVTGVMKMAIRTLGDPLLTYELYDDFVMADSIISMKGGDKKAPGAKYNARVSTLVQHVRCCVKQLPVRHNGLLRFLMTFLSKCASHHEQSKMTSANLAVVFGPNLLASQDDQVNMKDFKKVNNVIKALIDHANEIWEADGFDEKFDRTDQGFKHQANTITITDRTVTPKLGMLVQADIRKSVLQIGGPPPRKQSKAPPPFKLPTWQEGASGNAGPCLPPWPRPPPPRKPSKLNSAPPSSKFGALREFQAAQANKTWSSSMEKLHSTPPKEQPPKPKKGVRTGGGRKRTHPNRTSYCDLDLIPNIKGASDDFQPPAFIQEEYFGMKGNFPASPHSSRSGQNVHRNRSSTHLVILDNKPLLSMNSKNLNRQQQEAKRELKLKLQKFKTTATKITELCEKVLSGSSTHDIEDAHDLLGDLLETIEWGCDKLPT